MKLLHIAIIGVFIWLVMPNINFSKYIPSMPKSISVDPIAVLLFALVAIAVFAARAKNKKRTTTMILNKGGH